MILAAHIWVHTVLQLFDPLDQIYVAWLGLVDKQDTFPAKMSVIAYHINRALCIIIVAG